MEGRQRETNMFRAVVLATRAVKRTRAEGMCIFVERSGLDWIRAFLEVVG